MKNKLDYSIDEWYNLNTQSFKGGKNQILQTKKSSYSSQGTRMRKRNHERSTADRVKYAFPPDRCRDSVR